MVDGCKFYDCLPAGSVLRLSVDGLLKEGGRESGRFVSICKEPGILQKIAQNISMYFMVVNDPN